MKACGAPKATIPQESETYLEHRQRGSQAPDLVIWPPATYRGIARPRACLTAPTKPGVLCGNGGRIKQVLRPGRPREHVPGEGVMDRFACASAEATSEFLEASRVIRDRQKHALLASGDEQLRCSVGCLMAHIS